MRLGIGVAFGAPCAVPKTTDQAGDGSLASPRIGRYATPRFNKLKTQVLGAISPNPFKPQTLNPKP